MLSGEKITHCAYCGKEIPYDEARFSGGQTGEPYCDECRAEEEGDLNDG